MARDQRKGGRRRIPTSGTDVPKGIFYSWMWDSRDRIKDERRYGIPLRKNSRRNWKLVVLSYHDRNVIILI